MIKLIAKKELLVNLMTFKFAVGFIVCIVLIAVFTPILLRDYQQRLSDYNENVAANEAELRNVKVYKNIKPTVYRPPNPLSVLSEGLEKQLGRSAKVELGGVSEISTASSGGNPFLSIFPTMDITLILKVVMSILAFLIAYNTISGEREQGTLKLILTGRAARYHVLMGKLLAGLLTLFIPVTMAFIVLLIILQIFPMVSLTGSDYVRILLMYLTSLIFISAMYNIGLLFSCLMRRASISLVLAMFIWILLTVVIPNGSIYLASSLRPAEAREKMEAQVGALEEQKDIEIANLTAKLRTGGNQAMAIGAFRGIYILHCEKALMEDYKKQYMLTEPVRIRYADKIFDIQQQYLQSLTKQKHLARTMAQISPMTLYESIMSALAGTDLVGFGHFRSRVQLHTDELILYIRSKTDNFSLPSYFTPSKEGEHEVLRKRSYRELLKQMPTLNLQDLPRFHCGLGSLAEVLRKTFPHIGLLLFVNVLFFALSFVAFQKYDVR